MEKESFNFAKMEDPSRLLEKCIETNADKIIKIDKKNKRIRYVGGFGSPFVDEGGYLTLKKGDKIDVVKTDNDNNEYQVSVNGVLRFTKAEGDLLNSEIPFTSSKDILLIEDGDKYIIIEREKAKELYKDDEKKLKKLGVKKATLTREPKEEEKEMPGKTGNIKLMNKADKEFEKGFVESIALDMKDAIDAKTEKEFQEKKEEIKKEIYFHIIEKKEYKNFSEFRRVFELIYKNPEELAAGDNSYVISEGMVKDLFKGIVSGKNVPSVKDSLEDRAKKLREEIDNVIRQDENKVYKDLFDAVLNNSNIGLNRNKDDRKHFKVRLANKYYKKANYLLLENAKDKLLGNYVAAERYTKVNKYVAKAKKVLSLKSKEIKMKQAGKGIAIGIASVAAVTILLSGAQKLALLSRGNKNYNDAIDNGAKAGIEVIEGKEYKYAELNGEKIYEGKKVVSDEAVASKIEKGIKNKILNPIGEFFMSGKLHDELPELDPKSSTPYTDSESSEATDKLTIAGEIKPGEIVDGIVAESNNIKWEVGTNAKGKRVLFKNVYDKTGNVSESEKYTLLTSVKGFESDSEFLGKLFRTITKEDLGTGDFVAVRLGENSGNVDGVNQTELEVVTVNAGVVDHKNVVEIKGAIFFKAKGGAELTLSQAVSKARDKVVKGLVSGYDGTIVYKYNDIKTYLPTTELGKSQPMNAAQKIMSARREQGQAYRANMDEFLGK